MTDRFLASIDAIDKQIETYVQMADGMASLARSYREEKERSRLKRRTERLKHSRLMDSPYYQMGYLSAELKEESTEQKLRAPEEEAETELEKVSAEWRERARERRMQYDEISPLLEAMRESYTALLAECTGQVVNSPDGERVREIEQILLDKLQQRALAPYRRYPEKPEGPIEGWVEFQESNPCFAEQLESLFVAIESIDPVFLVFGMPTMLFEESAES